MAQHPFPGVEDQERCGQWFIFRGWRQCFAIPDWQKGVLFEIKPAAVMQALLFWDQTQPEVMLKQKVG